MRKRAGRHGAIEGVSEQACACPLPGDKEWERGILLPSTHPPLCCPCFKQTACWEWSMLDFQHALLLFISNRIDVEEEVCIVLQVRVKRRGQTPDCLSLTIWCVISTKWVGRAIWNCGTFPACHFLSQQHWKEKGAATT